MDSLYILNYETIKQCKCKNYGCFDEELLNCFNKYTIYKYCPFLKLIYNDIKISIYESYKISNANEYFTILEYLLLWAHKSNNYKSDIRLRTIIMLSICHFMITNKDFLDDIIIFYDRFINQVIILLETFFIPKKTRYHFIKLFKTSFIEDKHICIDQVFNWLFYFKNIL
jgi:hypothetical protein